MVLLYAAFLSMMVFEYKSIVESGSMQEYYGTLSHVEVSKSSGGKHSTTLFCGVYDYYIDGEKYTCRSALSYYSESEVPEEVLIYHDSFTGKRTTESKELGSYKYVIKGILKLIPFIILGQMAIIGKEERLKREQEQQESSQ